MKVLYIWCSFAIAGLMPFAFARGSSNDRDVCIIGAGAAGVSAAYFLEGYGYSVSVFEKLDRVGGKCFSPSVGPNGERIDLGAVLVSADYDVTRMFISQFNLKLRSVPNSIITDYATQSIIPRGGDPDLLQAAINYYISIINTKYPELLNTPGFDTASMTTETLNELTLPFYDWLSAHSLQDLVPFFTIPISYYGYGLLTQIPAMYAIKLMNELNTKSMLANGAFGSNTPLDIMATIDGGYQKLIEAIAGSLEDVHLNADVLLNRRTDVSNEQAFLSYSDKNGMQHTYSCGKVIAAFPQKSSLMDFMGLDDLEKTLFDKPFTQNYFTSSVSGISTPQGDELSSGAYYNAAFANPASQLQWDGSTILFTKNFDNVDYAVVYQYALPDSNRTDEDILAKIPDDMESYGVGKGDIENFNRWEYSPAVSPKEIGNGFYEDLEALQGYRGTFYAGSLLNFETVENVMLYSKKLVETHFSNKNRGGKKSKKSVKGKKTQKRKSPNHYGKGRVHV